jgi:hypothetical protein
MILVEIEERKLGTSIGDWNLRHQLNMSEIQLAVACLAQASPQDVIDACGVHPNYLGMLRIITDPGWLNQTTYEDELDTTTYEDELDTTTERETTLETQRKTLLSKVSSRPVNGGPPIVPHKLNLMKDSVNKNQYYDHDLKIRVISKPNRCLIYINLEHQILVHRTSDKKTAHEFLLKWLLDEELSGITNQYYSYYYDLIHHGE